MLQWIYLGVLLLIALVTVRWSRAKTERLIRKQTYVPTLAPPVSVDRIQDFLDHIRDTYALDEEHKAHDEAHGAAPGPIAIPRKAKHKNKPTVTPRAQASATAPDVLAKGLKIAARITYTKGQHAGMARDVVIITILGLHGDGGELTPTAVRCICSHVKGWRCFRIEYIAELIDLRTGEIIRDVHAWLDHELAKLV